MGSKSKEVLILINSAIEDVDRVRDELAAKLHESAGIPASELL